MLNFEVESMHSNPTPTHEPSDLSQISSESICSHPTHFLCYYYFNTTHVKLLSNHIVDCTANVIIQILTRLKVKDRCSDLLIVTAASELNEHRMSCSGTQHCSSGPYPLPVYQIFEPSPSTSGVYILHLMSRTRWPSISSGAGGESSGTPWPRGLVSLV
ncbi:hypothetical protein AMELA_G00165870 [Ameiurus melas]|uniref:Uncharacterized protein n=1 Tax=Ameiurus melas TaxID=219545 RepID=A0A7J6ABM9_AMEME|nr:hypothetical protein AMELA_G00165870 [Ameiurus melas]